MIPSGFFQVLLLLNDIGKFEQQVFFKKSAELRKQDLRISKNSFYYLLL